MPTLACPHCGATASPDLYWKPTSNPEITHLGARCAACGRFIKWVPQTTAWLDESPIRGYEASDQSPLW